MFASCRITHFINVFKWNIVLSLAGESEGMFESDEKPHRGGWDWCYIVATAAEISSKSGASESNWSVGSNMFEL